MCILLSLYQLVLGEVSLLEQRVLDTEQCGQLRQRVLGHGITRVSAQREGGSFGLSGYPERRGRGLAD